MSRGKNKKKIIFVLLFSIILLFMVESGGRLRAIDAEECWEAWEMCMGEYGGWLPTPYNTPAVIYCGIGLIFCNLYM